MPGSGKTTLGKIIAKKLSLPFMDLDDKIVEKEKRTIPQIFQKEGETYFRKLEAEILREISLTHETFLLATGGGAPCYHDNLEFIRQQGLSIFLEVSVQELVNRLILMGLDSRPLLKDFTEDQLLAEIQQKLNVRLPYYIKADIVVNVDDLDTERVVDRIRTYQKNS